MIFELITNAFFFIPELLIEELPSIGDKIIWGDFDVTKTYIFRHIYLLTAFFPVFEVTPLVFISLSLLYAKFIISVIVRIKSFIPTMGA